MTDGFWNGDSPEVGNQDGGKGAPYQDSYSDTLADVAMKYYSEDLVDGVANQAPKTRKLRGTWRRSTA